MYFIKYTSLKSKLTLKSGIKFKLKYLSKGPWKTSTRSKPRWSDIPSVVANKDATELIVPGSQVEGITSKVLRSPL